MKLSITQEHIDNGIECDPYDCAASKALKEQFPSCRFIVDSQFITVVKGKEKVDFDNTEELTNFIHDYDCSAMLAQPCRLKLPDDLVEFITGRKDNNDDE